MAVETPNIRGPIVARMHFHLRVGAKGKELHASPAHATVAGRISQMSIVDRILNRRNDENLFEYTRRYGARRIRPDAEGAKPIGIYFRWVGRAGKHRGR